MSKEIIIKLLKERGKTTGHIVVQLGVSYQAVYKGMAGKCSRRVRVAIALAVGKSPSMLWMGEVSNDVLVVDDLHYIERLKAANQGGHHV